MSVARRVVITDHAFDDTSRERAVAVRHGAQFAEHACESEAETAAAVEGAAVVLNNFAPMTRDVMAGLAPAATVIRYGVGVDNVDLEAASDLGVAVCNVPDYGVSTVADHAAAALLSLLRRLPHHDAAVKRDGWAKPSDVGPVPGFTQVTVGLLGAGRIARAVIDRLRPFGFGFIAFDPGIDPEVLTGLSIEPVGLEELARRSHALTIHAPLTAATRRVVDAGFLRSMPQCAVLVNTARGGLVDLDALTSALAVGHLAGAALDVTDPEPLPSGSCLREMPQVILSPHAAFYANDSLVNLQRLAAEEAGRALAGAPLRCCLTTPHRLTQSPERKS